MITFVAMGLDWIAESKAKVGHEAEFLELKERGITEERQARYDEVSIAPYTMVGAPMVGTDKVADAWILMVMRMPEGAEEYPDVDLESEEASTPANDKERAVLEEGRGYRVLELAPPCDGVPIYSHGSIMDELDQTSFRGKFLSDCEDIIGDALMSQAYGDQSAGELDVYGKKLLEHARRHAAEHSCSQIEQEREPPEDCESPAAQAHILFAAGRWCCYWGSRGFSLNAWS